MKNHQSLVKQVSTSANKNVLLGFPVILLFAVCGVYVDIRDRFNVNLDPVLAQTPAKSAIKSPFADRIIITEVLYRQTGVGAGGNNEFIEIYNASTSAIDLSAWKLADGNLIENSTDSIGSITGRSNNPAYIFPTNTILKSQEYAVIWIGKETPQHQAETAAFQAWLGQEAKLNDEGDDVWLYDERSQIVDYVAYGSSTAINTPPPASLNLWDDSYQLSLRDTVKGQSIGFSNIASGSHSSVCWEPTNSAVASTRCSNYTKTLDIDDRANTVTSVGKNNYNIALNPSPSPQPSTDTTSSPQPSPEATATPTPESSPEATPTSASSPEVSANPTLTPEPSPTETSTHTPQPSPEAIAAPTTPQTAPENTATPTLEPSPTPESSPQVTVTPTPESSPEVTATPTPEPAPENTVTPTPTPQPSPEVTSSPQPLTEATVTPTTSESSLAETVTPSPQPSPEVAATPTPTPTPESSPQAQATLSPQPASEVATTPTPTPESSPQVTVTPSPQPSPQENPSPEAAVTPSPQPSPQPAPEVTTTPTSTPESSPPATVTPSPQPSPEVATTPTPTPESSPQENPSPQPSPEGATTPTPETTASPLPETVINPSPQAITTLTPNPESTPKIAATPQPSPAIKPTTTPEATPTGEPILQTTITHQPSLEVIAPTPQASPEIPATRSPQSTPTSKPSSQPSPIANPSATPIRETIKPVPTLIRNIPSVPVIKPTPRLIVQPKPIPETPATRSQRNSEISIPASPQQSVQSPLPPKPSQSVQDKQLTLPTNVHFAFNRSGINPASRQVLQQIVAVLKQYPQINLELGGHTDSIGSDRYNLILGRQRANSVRRYLLRQGIAKERVIIRSWGEAQPKLSGKDSISRARNRRVNFVFKNLSNLNIQLVEQENDLQP